LRKSYIIITVSITTLSIITVSKALLRIKTLGIITIRGTKLNVRIVIIRLLSITTL